MRLTVALLVAMVVAVWALGEVFESLRGQAAQRGDRLSRILEGR